MKAWSRIILALALCGGLGMPRSDAADIKRDTIDGVPVILVSGQLLFGDEHRFTEVALGMPKAAVLLDGPGGNLLAGIEIGKAIREKGFVTVVPRSCASACATAWLGGKRRMVVPGARVGFHAAWQANGGRNEIVATGNALIGAYLNQLGLTSSAILYLTEAGPDEMKWLTQADALRFGIETQWGDDRPAIQTAARVAVPSVASAPPAAPGPSHQVYRPMDPGGMTGYGEWVQVASRKRLDLAVPVAESIRERNANTSVFLYDNGWSVVTVGPFSPGRGQVALEALVAAGEVPPDSMVVDGGRFVSLQWGQAPRRRLAAQDR